MNKRKFFTEKKVRYKMYKAGRAWVVAGMATMSFLTFDLLTSNTSLSAKADVTSTTANPIKLSDKKVVLSKTSNSNSVAQATDKTGTSSADTSQSQTGTSSADTSQNQTGTSSADTSQSQTGTNLADTAKSSSVTTGTSKHNSIGTRSSIDVQNAVSKVYNEVRKGLDANLANSVLLSVASDADSDRESFNDIVNNGKDTSPTSVHVAVADQVANKDKYYAEAKVNGTLAEVSTWDAFAKAYNTQSVTYIKLTKDISSGLSRANSNNSGTGNPLNQRTNGIIIDGDNNTLDLGLDVSMFVGTVPVGTQFTLTDVKLMQEHTQGSASSGSTRSVIQTPYNYRQTNDGLWTFNMNNIEYVGSATIDKAGNGNYGYTPARLVDMEDSLVNYSGNIKWYSDQELSTNGSVHIADGATIQYAQTYNRSDMDSVFYFMSWDHANTVNDTGAAHDIQIGDGSTLNLTATKSGTYADRTVFYNSWTDMNVGDNVTWNQDGFTQLFNSQSDRAIYAGGSGYSYSGCNTFFTNLVGHDLDHRSIKFGQQLNMKVPEVRTRAFYLDRNWSIYFAAATTLNVNLISANAAVYLRSGANITFVSPRKLSVQNNNGSSTFAGIFDVSGSESGISSKFTLNNSTINYWNRVAVSAQPTGSLTFRTLIVDSNGYTASDYAGNSLQVGTNTTLGSQTNAFTTLANDPGKIKIRYVNQNGVEVGTTEVSINNDNYIGQILSLRKPIYAITNMPANYMWAIDQQVYSGATGDKQSSGDPTSTVDDGDSYGQAMYAIVPAAEANRDNVYTIYVYGVPESVQYQYIDVRTGKVLTSDSLNVGQEKVGNLQPANFGNTINWQDDYYTKTNIPAGYHYATTVGELNGKTQPTSLLVKEANPTTVIYVAGDDASAKVNFYDTQSGVAVSNSTIDLTGYVGQTPTTGNDFLLPKNYQLDPVNQPNQSAFTSKVNNDGTITITYVKELATSDNDIQINLIHSTTDTIESKVVKRTIKYVDQADQTVSPDVMQTVEFVRTATTDDVDKTVTYSDWTSKTDTNFSPVVSPDVAGMFPDIKTVDDQTGITMDTADSEILVHYYKNEQMVTPDDPKDPNTPVDPNN
ncbi:mucin-binding protein, partial [Levilactobacillus brevis]|uniref:mucin-binding protein n=1 Tax=Levilactobacillus brevis TaxID=1580 RepID=UPI00177CB162